MSSRESMKRLHSKEKKFVASIASYFEEERGSNGAFSERTVQAKGVSRATIFRVRKELRETYTLTSPQRRSKGPYKPIDEFDEMVIRNKMKEFTTRQRRLPTLRHLLSILRKEIGYPGGRETLRKTLHNLGFEWKRTASNRKMLIEKPAVVSRRLEFYARKKELEDKKFTLVYIDETWVDSSYTANRCWQSETMAGAQPPCNPGQRLIVVHAGSRTGFVDGALLVYTAASSTGDYHSEMNGEMFQKWLVERLLPNLKGPCALVLDNASYHSMQSQKGPTTNFKKADIQQWLQKHQILYRETMPKPQLLELVKVHKTAPTYVIDDLIRSHGHEVLRLPPYHPELNAIELIWSQMKSIVRYRNVTYRLGELMALTKVAFEEISVDRWRNACDHVDKRITDMQKADNYHVETLNDSIIIDLRDDTTDTASEAGSTTESACEGKL